MKHTPGPWNVCEPVGWMSEGRYWTAEQMEQMWWVGKRPGVAVALIDGSADGREEAAANARLIAQAPAMFDALLELWGAGEWVWSEEAQATIFSIELSKDAHERIFMKTGKELADMYGED